MKHSDALTEQQKMDCLSTVGDWDAHCENVLANISREAVRQRLDAAVAAIGKIPDGNGRDAAIKKMVEAIPANALAGIAEPPVVAVKLVEAFPPQLP